MSPRSDGSAFSPEERHGGLPRITGTESGPARRSPGGSESASTTRSDSGHRRSAKQGSRMVRAEATARSSMSSPMTRRGTVRWGAAAPCTRAGASTPAPTARAARRKTPGPTAGSTMQRRPSAMPAATPQRSRENAVHLPRHPPGKLRGRVHNSARPAFRCGQREVAGLRRLREGFGPDLGGGPHPGDHSGTAMRFRAIAHDFPMDLMA
jgi:hypothetical protein